MNRCDKCRHWLRDSGGNYKQCLKKRWVTAAWFADCDSFQAPAPDVVDVPEPEEEPTSVLLEKYRGEGKT